MRISLPGLAGRFKNNALALVNALLSFLNSILYIRAFGLSLTSDSLYYATSVIAAFSLLPSFLMEQFLQYYNDYKHSDADAAATFLAFNLSNATILGLALTAVFGLAQGPLLSLLYPSLGVDALAKLSGFLGVMKYQLLLVGFSGILQGLCVSYGRIKAVYVGRILNSGVLLLGQLGIIARFLRLEAYPLLLVAGDCAFALFLVTANRRLIGGALRNARKVDLSFAALQKRYFLDSFVMRFGHNLQGFFLPLVTSAFWSGFSGNLATCYGYASKFYSAIQSVIIGPSQMETQCAISNAVSRREYASIGRTIRDYLKLYVPVSLAASAATAVLIPFVIRFINPSIGAASARVIVVCFAFLSVWLAVQCAEGPFVITIVAKNQGLVFVAANAVNIGIIAAVIFAFPHFFYSILIANILAQAASMSIYVIMARKILRSAGTERAGSAA
jgi:hypothetical protein